MGLRAAIAIGVGKAGNLPQLEAAVPDARRFADWARSNRYDDVRLIEDSVNPVTLAQIVTAVEEVIARDLDRLLLFFSGHGTSTGVADYWLLSNFHRNSNEAVNVLASINNAKRLPIGQIGVFADACRSAIPNIAMVTGGVVFPINENPTQMRPKWDHFFATHLSDIAQEVPGAADRAAFGVFSECLFMALNGQEPSILEPRTDPREIQVLCSDKLADWLDEKVPDASGRIPGAKVQLPDTNPGWRRPNDIYLEIDAPVRPVRRMAGDGPADGGAAVRERVDSAHAEVAERLRSTEAAVELHGRISFETRRGLTIHGARVEEVAAAGGVVELFEEGGLQHVRGYAGTAQTVALRLAGGNWFATVILPWFNGVVTIHDGAAIAFNYQSMPDGMYPAGPNPETDEPLRRWTALMSVGQAPRQELERLGHVIRYGKHHNPALGVLAAYAYERAGAIDEIDGIVGYFAAQDQPVLFDIAILSTYPVKREDRKACFRDPVRHRNSLLPACVAGTFPLMSRGWPMVDPRDPASHPELVKLCSGVLPSLWTMLNPRMGQRLAELIRAGEL